MRPWWRIGLRVYARKTSEFSFAQILRLILWTVGGLLAAWTPWVGQGAESRATSAPERASTGAILDHLAREIQGTNEVAATEAIATLGNIGTVAAVRTLEHLKPRVRPELRLPLTEALLACAEQLASRGDTRTAERIFAAHYQPTEIQAVRAAAFRGLVRVQGEDSIPLLLNVLGRETDPLAPIAVDQLRRLPGAKTSQKLADGLNRLPPSSQVQVLRALQDRGDPEALRGIAPLVRSMDTSVSSAALEAVGQLGGAAEVPLLVEYIAHPQKARAEAARASLGKLRGPQVDTRVVECLRKADHKSAPLLIEWLVQRQSNLAVPALLNLAAAPASPGQAAALAAVGALAGPTDLPVMVQLLSAQKDAEAARNIESAVSQVLRRCENVSASAQVFARYWPHSTNPSRPALLRLLGQLGGAVALETVRQAASDPNAEVAFAALRVLANWPDPTPLDDLRKIAEESPSLSTHLVAIHGFIRQLGLPHTRSAADHLAQYQQAFDLARRAEERNLVLASLTAIDTVEALRWTISLLDDDALNTEAALASIKIASALGTPHQEDARTALVKIRSSCRNDQIRQQAEAALTALERTRTSHE
jgi:HEAT repeat protein